MIKDLINYLISSPVLLFLVIGFVLSLQISFYQFIANKSKGKSKIFSIINKGLVLITVFVLIILGSSIDVELNKSHLLSLIAGYSLGFLIKAIVGNKAGRGALKYITLALAAATIWVTEKVLSLLGNNLNSRLAKSIKTQSTEESEDLNENVIYVFGRVDQRAKIIDTLLDEIKNEDGSVIVLDMKSIQLQRHFDQKRDFIFNPMDNRSVNWNPFKEVIYESDIKPIIDCITTREQNEIVAHSNAYLLEIAKKLFERNELDIGSFLWASCSTTYEQSYAFLQNTAFSRVLNSSNDPKILLKTIKKYCATRMHYFENLNFDKLPFSIKEMFEVRHKGCIFLPYKQQSLELIQKTLNIFISAALSELRLEEFGEEHPKVWFVLDGFTDIGFIENLEQAIKDANKLNAGFLLGAKSYEAIEEVYGQNKTKDLLNASDVFIIDQTCRDSYKIVQKNGLLYSPLAGLKENEAAYIDKNGRNPIVIPDLPEILLNSEPAVARQYSEHPVVRIQPGLELNRWIDQLIEQFFKEDPLEKRRMEEWESDESNFEEIELDPLAIDRLMSNSDYEEVEDLPAAKDTVRRSAKESESDIAVQVYSSTINKAMERLLVKASREGNPSSSISDNLSEILNSDRKSRGQDAPVSSLDLAWKAHEKEEFEGELNQGQESLKVEEDPFANIFKDLKK